MSKKDIDTHSLASSVSSDSVIDNNNVPRTLVNDDHEILSLATRQRSNISITSKNPHQYDENLIQKIRSNLSHTKYNIEKVEDSLADYTEIDRQLTRQTIVTVLSQRLDQQLELYENQKGIAKIKDIETSSSSVEDGDIENSEADILPTKLDGTEFASLDPELVTWDTENDTKHPRNWPKKKKLLTLFIMGIYTFSGQYAASGMTLGMPFIDKEFGVTNSYFSAIIVSIFLLTQGIFALITSPLSEIYGRRVILTTSIFCLGVFNIGCAVTNDPYSLFVCRLFLGVCASGPMAIGSSVISDIYEGNERGKYIILFGSCVNMAPIMGGVSSGLIVQYISWRWIFWVLVIVDFVAVFIGIFFLNETYSPILLQWKCEKLKKETGNSNLKTIYDIADYGETTWSKILLNIKRPVLLLFYHPMIYGLGIFMAFLFGYFYLILISFPTVWRNIYNFSNQTTGFMYFSVGAGYLVFNPIWVYVNNREYQALTKANNGVAKPEFRIKSLYLCGIFCPIGLLIYGWCVQYKTFWFCPCIGVFLYTGFYTGMFSFLTNYVVDMNPRYSASSNAALSLFRSFFGFAFPIFAPKMYRDIGYGWGNTIFFFTGIVLGIPFPFYVYKYGESLRKKANLKFDKRQAEYDAKKMTRLRKQMESNAS